MNLKEIKKLFALMLQYEIDVFESEGLHIEKKKHSNKSDFVLPKVKQDLSSFREKDIFTIPPRKKLDPEIANKYAPINEREIAKGLQK